MNDLFMLRETQIFRLSRISAYLMKFGGADVSAIIFVIRKGHGGAIRRALTGRTRRSTTGSSAGAVWACSTASLSNCRRRPENQTESWSTLPI